MFISPDTQENANRIAQTVTVEYESLGPPIVTTEDAIRANSYVDNVKPAVIKIGDAKSECSTLLCCVLHVLKITGTCS